MAGRAGLTAQPGLGILLEMAADLDDDTVEALVALAKLEGKSPKEYLADQLRERTGSHLSRRERADDEAEESPAEAKERWYREESELPDGVLSLGGMTGGGIFGEGPVATEGYDPMAHDRGEVRMARAMQLQGQRQLNQLLDRIEKLEAMKLPSERRADALPGRRR